MILQFRPKVSLSRIELHGRTVPRGSVLCGRLFRFVGLFGAVVGLDLAESFFGLCLGFAEVSPGLGDIQVAQ